MNTPSNQTRKKTDVSISGWTANWVALGLMPVVAVVVGLPYWLVWGLLPSDNLILTPRLFFLAVGVVIISLFIHEALHGLGFFWFGKVPKETIEFGFHWRALAPYAHCKSQMSISAYRGSVFLPALVLGVIPTIIGILFGLGWLCLYSMLMLMTATGDFIVLWVTRKVAGTAQVVDHPERVGCYIMQ